ncbi:MAG: gluconate 2-dehydrogenase subunit 3 family protein, partial [Acidobacteria bacterium]|nr:gluconate 2-dehydrogenase subunit 3 family protein [Acidobacteriota bacterium]
MQLTPRQKRALESICETFLPETDGWPSAVQLGVPDALAEALEFNPRTQDRARFLNLLDVWDSKLHAFLLAGEYGNFSALKAEVREKILRSWADSSLRKRRAAFQALRKAIGFLYVMLPEYRGAANPVWKKIGYPGPLGAKAQGARPLRVTTPEKEITASCDVCVIGSGAGGGVAAAVLAAAGKDVVVLEAGNYYDDADFDGAELGGFQRLYSEGGFAATEDHSVGFLAGECLGGGTVVNYCTSFRTPDDIRTEWAEAGVRWIAGAE